MNKVKIIIDKLATEFNIFEIIELSKIIPEINLIDYIDLLPQIYVNFDDPNAGLTDNQFFEYGVLDIDSFILNDGTYYKIYKDKAKEYKNLDIYLQNIKNVKYILFNSFLNDYHYCYVIDGDMNTSDASDYRSIEYKFHNYNGYAFEHEHEKFYAINEKILDEQEFKMKIRKEKLKSIVNDFK